MTNFTGSSGDDIFTGGSDDDLVVGNAGADKLSGGNGSDTLYSGALSPAFTQPYYLNPFTFPLLDTGSDADTLAGGAGGDRLFAGFGDAVDGGADSDTLYISFLGAAAGITIDFGLTSQSIGGALITGIENAGWVQGSNFADELRDGGTGYSAFAPFFGMGGNDTIVAGYYTGYIDGGDGDDILDNRGAGYGSPVVGGAGNDRIFGGSGYENLAGGDGNDTIEAAYGYDRVDGGDGDDSIDGGSFGDTLVGGNGDDTLYGAADADGIDGGAGDDLLYGDFSPLGGGNAISPSINDDTLAGGAGADTLYGNEGNDVLASGDGNPAFSASVIADSGIERDRLFGGTGNDTLSIGYGDDADGGSGDDFLRVSFLGAVDRVTFDTTGFPAGSVGRILPGGGVVKNVETLGHIRAGNSGITLNVATMDALLVVEGGDDSDIVTSNGSSVQFNGGRGNDVFESGAAGDIFDGGEGFDTIVYSTYTAGITVRIGMPGPGGDQFSNVEFVSGSLFNDVLEGDGNGNTLRGLGGDDTLIGNAGDDFLDGREFGGAAVIGDLLVGGGGNDSYQVDSQSDLVVENVGGGRDLIVSSVSYYLYANIEELGLLSGNIFGVGNDLDNRIIGGDGANLIIAGTGNDEVFGNQGNDLLFGEAGNDTLFGNEGIDYLIGGHGNDYIDGGDDADEIYGQAGNDQLYGGIDFATDILVAGDDNDFLDGASGLGDYDLLYGGTGDDGYRVDTPADLVFEFAGGGTDTVRANIVGAGYYLYANTENLILEGQTPFGVGNELANVLTGNSIGNYLLGGLGNDTLDGGAGNDVLFGEGGADRFVFGRGTGGDVVGDFQAGTDKIVLTGMGFASFAQLQASFVEVAGTTAIDLGQGDLIVLNGVANAALSAGDFVLG